MDPEHFPGSASFVSDPIQTGTKIKPHFFYLSLLRGMFLQKVKQVGFLSFVMADFFLNFFLNSGFPTCVFSNMMLDMTSIYLRRMMQNLN